jgi:AcrR family transcriptional regulator
MTGRRELQQVHWRSCSRLRRSLPQWRADTDRTTATGPTTVTHYYNPLYPWSGLAAAVVGTAAAIVTLPFAILGAAAATRSCLLPAGSGARGYYPQGNAAPGYGAQGYAPPRLLSRAGRLEFLRPPPPSYAPGARYDAPRYPQYGDLDDYRGPAANNGYYRQDVPPPGGYYAPRPAPYGSPYGRFLLVQHAESALRRLRGARNAPPSSVPPAAKRKAVPLSPRRLRAAAPPRRPPSRNEAAQLSDRILDAAADLFFARGYGATSIEAVAQRARVSKRTFYHRFEDKATLFGAVLHRIIEGLRPPPAIPIVAGADLAEILRRLAGLILHAGTTPQALALHRLIVGESARFPKLAAAVTSEGATQEAIKLIGDVLAHEARAGTLTLDHPAQAAEQFLYLVLSVPQRRALGLGKPMTAAELDQWPSAVVDLFLNGCRTRTAARTKSAERKA